MINLLLLFAVLQSPLHHVSGANVTIYYPVNINASTAGSYLSAIERMCLDERGKFKIRSGGKLKVRLCRDAYEFLNLTGVDSLFSPVWKINDPTKENGVLYIAVQGDLSDSSYRSILEAGVIRALLDRLLQNGAPRWLVNSAAVYESGEYKSCTSPSIEYIDYFSDLNEKIQTAASPTELTDLCFYFGSTGRFFDLRFGAGALPPACR